MLKIAFYKSRKRIGAKAYCVDTRSILAGGSQKYFDTKQEAQRYIDRVSKELVINDTDAWSWNFEKLRNAYLIHLQKELRDGERSKSYVQEKERHTNQFISCAINGGLLADMLVSDLTKGQIELQLMDQLKKNRSKKTVINLMGSIMTMMSFATKYGCRETNPCIQVQIKGDAAKSKRKTKARRIQPDIINSIIAKMTPEWQLMARFACQTGLRQGEQRALTWEDILFDENKVRVNKAYKHRAGIGETKTEAGDRLVPLTREIKTALQEHFIACGRPNDPTALVFGTSAGITLKVVFYESRKKIRSPYCVDTRYLLAGGSQTFFATKREAQRFIECALTQSMDRRIVGEIARNGYTAGSVRMPARFLSAIHKACDDAGVDKIRWHDLRHYYASVMLKVYSKEIWRVSNYLGHEQVATTTNIYGHWIEDETDNAKEVDAISSAFG